MDAVPGSCSTLDQLVADIALCEGDLGESFVRERDAFLPDDEALLAARWQLTERSLFEVVAAGPATLKLRDLRTGEHITVTNTNAESQTRRGHLMLGRPLPVGDTWRAYSGFVSVGGLLRDEILEALDRADPFEIADLVGRCLAPPQMRNTDGDPLQFHDLVWHLTDPEAAPARTRRARRAHRGRRHLPARTRQREPASDRDPEARAHGKRTAR